MSGVDALAEGSGQIAQQAMGPSPGGAAPPKTAAKENIDGQTPAIPTERKSLGGAPAATGESHARWDRLGLCRLCAASTQEAHSPTPSPPHLAVKAPNKTDWLRSEERFFYEYLRIAGDRPQADCCQDIATALRTKTPEQVSFWFNKTLKLLKHRMGDQLNLETVSAKRANSLMVGFYDRHVVSAGGTSVCLRAWCLNPGPPRAVGHPSYMHLFFPSRSFP